MYKYSSNISILFIPITDSEASVHYYGVYHKDKKKLFSSLKKDIKDLEWNQILEYELNEDEMQQISSLDKGYTGSRAKHFDPEFVKMCLSKKIHDEYLSYCF